MSFQYLNNADAGTARQEYLQLLERAGMCAGEEILPAAECCGRVTARAVYAKISVPHYYASAMDGIALRAERTFGATETTPVHLEEGDYLVVDTGDPVPDAYDAVVMIEDVVEEEGGVCLYGAAAPWQHIRQIGEDMCAGEMILGACQKISPSAVGALLAGGILELAVLRRPVIGIIPTGDEIILPTDSPRPGDIVEFNGSIFSAMAGEWGAEARLYPIVKDRKDLIADAVRTAASECDMVIVNAGSSAGRDDYSAQVIRELGEVLYHGIAIKPGKPAILGAIGRVPVMGVPGYPVSAILVVREFLKPVIDLWFHQAPEGEERAEAILSRALVSGLKYKEFVRVRLGWVKNRLIASPLNRGAGVISSFVKADGILEIPKDVEGYEAGDRVEVGLLRKRSELVNTLVCMGSHDPLLDEAADLLHRMDPSLFMSSTHVGSMGGILSAKRGELHVAGIHLLDERDGSYNSSYLKKYFPTGGVRLVECVGRSQGLIVAKGNPMKISSIRDLVREDLRYVNRQKGSGTRILLDYLLRQEGIDCSQVAGYEREEFTHTSVAAQIAAGSADAGLGIWSAAGMYDLDFIPICVEQYDLLIPDYAWDTDMVRTMLSVLASEAFRLRLEELGGYQVGQPGRVREHLIEADGEKKDREGGEM